MPAYFAFGANMCPDVLSRRQIAWDHAVPAQLKGYQLEFTVAGLPWVEPAFANVALESNGVVHGVLYDMSRDALDRLGGFEGEDYREISVEVETADGVRTAITYECVRPVVGRKPSRRYIGVLRTGAVHHGLSDEFVASLDRIDSAYVPVLSEVAAASFGLVDLVHRSFARAAKPLD